MKILVEGVMERTKVINKRVKCLRKIQKLQEARYEMEMDCYKALKPYTSNEWMNSE